MLGTESARGRESDGTAAASSASSCATDAATCASPVEMAASSLAYDCCRWWPHTWRSTATHSAASAGSSVRSTALKREVPSLTLEILLMPF